MNSRILLMILIALAIIGVVGCFPTHGVGPAEDRVGFFTGIWHGWIAPISLIVGIFDNDIRIYEPFNTGWWYDLGFYIAVIAGFGGIAIFRRERKRETTKE